MSLMIVSSFFFICQQKWEVLWLVAFLEPLEEKNRKNLKEKFVLNSVTSKSIDRFVYYQWL